MNKLFLITLLLSCEFVYCAHENKNQHTSIVNAQTNKSDHYVIDIKPMYSLTNKVQNAILCVEDNEVKFQESFQIHCAGGDSLITVHYPVKKNKIVVFRTKVLGIIYHDRGYITTVQTDLAGEIYSKLSYEISGKEIELVCDKNQQLKLSIDNKTLE